MAWAILAILVIIAFVLIGMYNSLGQLRVRTDTAWSDIDVQLKRRHDEIRLSCAHYGIAGRFDHISGREAGLRCYKL